VMGPGVVTPLYPGEKLVAAPIQPLPAAVAEYLKDGEEDMAILSFSMRLLTGEAQGDPSGYGIEQTRQAAMARLMPYKTSLDRALSRLFEKILGCLSQNWAEEWGDSVTLTGQQDGEFFNETITPLDLWPAPDHVEVKIFPALPQNKIAESQNRLARIQGGTMDHLDAMEEEGVADPQTTFESWLYHKEIIENPQARMMAVQAIIQKRAAANGVQLPPPAMPMQEPPPGPPAPGGPPPAPGQSPATAGMPGGATVGAPPPQLAPNTSIGPQGAPLPPAPRQGARGPLPQQRPAMAPQGGPGSPNPSIPVRTKRPMPGRR